jgi:hypothetical protein
LESIGFEWDPQRAQWNIMFEKLLSFHKEVGHCKVPKGYTKDPELANWVRNQRLEHANMTKNKMSRMTQDRYKLLDDLGFKWSTAMPHKPRKPVTAATTTTIAVNDVDGNVNVKTDNEKGDEAVITTTETPTMIAVKNDVDVNVNDNAVLLPATSQEPQEAATATETTTEEQVEAVVEEIPPTTQTQLEEPNTVEV